MLILPVTGALFVLLFSALIGGGGPPGVATLVGIWVIIYAFIGAYWVLLWRSAIRWTRQRVILTILAAPAALVLGALAGTLSFQLMRGAAVELAFLVGGGVPPIAWVVATVPIWTETPRERIERLSSAGRDTVCCPVCGYNLTGLHEARCPECGSRFTLDQLVATQPERDTTTLQDE